MSPQPDEPRLWIDNSLSPLVAQALRLVGYNIVVQADIAEFIGLPRVLDDRHIFPWLEQYDAIWIHADDSANNEHRKQLIVGRLRTIWVHRPGGKMGNREQLRILAFKLPEILEEFAIPRPRSRHFEIRVHGEPPHTNISHHAFELRE